MTKKLSESEKNSLGLAEDMYNFAEKRGATNAELLAAVASLTCLMLQGAPNFIKEAVITTIIQASGGEAHFSAAPKRAAGIA